MMLFLIKVIMEKGVFNRAWSQKYTWVKELKRDSRRALCFVCGKDFDIGAMGESALKLHMASEKHEKK